MGSYSENRSWSDLMLDQIRQIVGPLLLRPTPHEMDCRQAADLYIFTGRGMTIAARVRRFGYADKYPYEFTVRSVVQSGAKTELAKIIDGFGDWFFYGHSSPDSVVTNWWLIDLDSFRAALIRDGRFGFGLGFKERSNKDGTRFISFDLRSFPASPPILIGSSHPLPHNSEVAA